MTPPAHAALLPECEVRFDRLDQVAAELQGVGRAVARIEERLAGQAAVAEQTRRASEGGMRDLRTMFVAALSAGLAAGLGLVGQLLLR